MLKNPSLCITSIILVTILVLSSSPALAAERDHEEGFFLRLAAGAGPAGTEIEVDSDNRFKFDGTGADVEVAIGGIVMPNLAVHGTLWGWLITDPDAEIELFDVGEGSGTVDGDFSLSGIGAGLTYFIMPINMYLTGSVGFGVLSFDFGGLSLESDTGFSLEAALGKEWFVSDRWGIGLAVGITYHSISEPDVDENWSGISIPVRFSATLN
jgi:hypothetical protein